MTQRALLDTMEPFDTSSTGVHKGRSDPTPEVHAPFATVHQTLISEALAFNRSSCALSNSPEEHEPGKEYLSHGAYRDKACILSQSLHLLLVLSFRCILANRLFILKLTRQSYLE
ncbi:MAG: hypothetical protein M1492_03090 [Gammaproteobacteria bacterium]|nr:hypothetical protein [Gammaproteobacteria bacterium]